MRVATWNVNSIRARMPRLENWLELQQPDVVCLQETKVQDHQFPAEHIEELGYRVAYSGQKTYNGVAILSKRPIEAVHCGFGDAEFDGEARAIGATIDDVVILNLYVVNGKEVGHDRYDYKLAWLERLRKFVVASYDLSEKVVLCGDFNITFDDRDIYDPEKWRDKILCSQPERDVLGALCELGLHDALRKFHSDTGIFTWWDFRTRGFQRGNRGLRIDHFLMSQSALDACEGVEVDTEERGREKPSDHAPVIATLR